MLFQSSLQMCLCSNLLAYGRKNHQTCCCAVLLTSEACLSVDSAINAILQVAPEDSVADMQLLDTLVRSWVSKVGLTLCSSFLKSCQSSHSQTAWPSLREAAQQLLRCRCCLMLHLRRLPWQQQAAL